MNWKKEWTVPVITGGVSFVAGVAVGYIATIYQYKKIERSIEELEENTTELEKDMVRVMHKMDDRTEHVTQALEYAWNIVGVVTDEETDNEETDDEETDDEERLDGIGNHPTHSGPPMTIGQTIFTDEETGDVWDYTLETEERENRESPELPYVIHRDEFNDDDQGYSHVTLTYYSGDNVLSDEDDTPIFQPERIVGELKFGHGSNDINVVFVRNDKLMAEYEIIHDHGYYQVEVLGEEIEHALSQERSTVSKFRPSD